MQDVYSASSCKPPHMPRFRTGLAARRGPQQGLCHHQHTYVVRVSQPPHAHLSTDMRQQRHCTQVKSMHWSCGSCASTAGCRVMLCSSRRCRMGQPPGGNRLGNSTSGHQPMHRPQKCGAHSAGSKSAACTLSLSQSSTLRDCRFRIVLIGATG